MNEGSIESSLAAGVVVKTGTLLVTDGSMLMLISWQELDPASYDVPGGHASQAKFLYKGRSAGQG